MKFLSIKLNNYIGIYNGMGLYNIDIDMTKCRHRMTIIRGEYERAARMLKEYNDQKVAIARNIRA